MSIGVIIGVHDGIVLGADSASSLIVSAAPGVAAGVANVYDNANKIFNLYKGMPIGCVTFGAGSIGKSSIGTLIKDLRRSLADPNLAKDFGFDPENYTMEGVANIVSKFISDECQKAENAPNLPQMDLGLLIGGYSTGKSLGESWSVTIKGGKATNVKMLRKPDEPGISWGGQTEVLQRIVLGHSPALYDALASVMAPPAGAQAPTAAQLANDLGPLLRARLQAQVVFAHMPIQDAIDVGRFLVDSAIMFSRFLPGAQTVGGPIELAAITKHEGFKWVARKHYYERDLNPGDEL